jgi:hypothetical protein
METLRNEPYVKISIHLTLVECFTDVLGGNAFESRDSNYDSACSHPIYLGIDCRCYFKYEVHSERNFQHV